MSVAIAKAESEHRQTILVALRLMGKLGSSEQSKAAARKALRDLFHEDLDPRTGEFRKLP
jgi:hypothetical protein